MPWKKWSLWMKKDDSITYCQVQDDGIWIKIGQIIPSHNQSLPWNVGNAAAEMNPDSRVPSQKIGRFVWMGYQTQLSMEENDENNGTNQCKSGSRKSRTLELTILLKREGSQCYGYQFIERWWKNEVDKRWEMFHLLKNWTYGKGP